MNRLAKFPRKITLLLSKYCTRIACEKNVGDNLRTNIVYEDRARKEMAVGPKRQ